MRFNLDAISWIRLAGIGLSGIMLIAAYPPINAGWMAYLALIPYLLVVYSCRKRRQVVAFTILLAAIWGTGLFYFTLFMPATTIGERLTAYVAVLSVFALEIVIYGLGVRFLFINGPPVVAAICTGLWWSAVEWLGARYLFGFSPFLGLTQWQYPHIVVLARYIGLHGISTLVALVNAGLWLLLKVTKENWHCRRLLHVTASICLLLAIVLLWQGSNTPAWLATSEADIPISSYLSTANEEPTLVVAVQNAFTMQEYEATVGDDVALSGLFDKLLTQTTAGVQVAGKYWRQQNGDTTPLPNVVVLWPETVLHEPLLSYQDYYQRLIQQLHKNQVWLVAGLPWMEDGYFYNAAILLNPAGAIVSRYAKVRTIPIAESWAKPGAAWQPLSLNTTALGVALCSEIIDPMPIKKLVANGAQIVAVLSSMDYLGLTSAPVLQAAFAPFRAAEYGKYLVMTGSVGVTLVATPAGQISQHLAWGKPGVLVAALPAEAKSTLYAKLGDVLPFAGLLVMAGTCLRFWRCKREDSIYRRIKRRK